MEVRLREGYIHKERARSPRKVQTNLADILQYRNDESEVANMEDGQREPDMAEVTNAVLESLVAC